MQSNIIIIAMICTCLAMIFLIILAKPIKYIVCFFRNALLGGAGIFLSNILLAPLGVCLGINPLTLCVIGLLGLPGFAALLFIGAVL